MRTRTWILPAVVAIVAIGSTAAQNTGTSTFRVGPERAMHGLTVAEQAAQRLQLHGEISAIMPPGATTE